VLNYYASILTSISDLYTSVIISQAT